MSQRIRMNEQSSWPERVGCLGILAEPTAEQARRYPIAGMSKREVIVLLDDDPLRRDDDEEHCWWTCVTSVYSVDFLPEDP